ncbi:Cytochrome P450 monooxygenase gsfF [Colletotrichum viniferum]|nr:Cytochrome P450 monooxygenase gsfF [Colletotrichum viniferum]
MIPFVCLMGVAPPILRPFVGIGCMLTSAGKEIANGVKNIGESSARLMKDAYESRLEAPRTDMAQQVFSIYEKCDTTAIAFRSPFYHLMHYSEAYRKLEAEVDQAVNEGRLSMPPTYKEASQLPHLCACIKEALRIHPGAQLLFGADAESFNPDRWMDQSRANYMDKFMMAFGGGTRTCLGMNIALIELHKLSPQLVWNYRFEFYDQAKTQWHTRNTFFARQEGVVARVKRRNH